MYWALCDQSSGDALGHPAEGVTVTMPEVMKASNKGTKVGESLAPLPTPHPPPVRKTQTGSKH